jgi:uncharacterized phage infection (PIP) family protein YhgE
MNTYRIYEDLRSSLGEEAAKSLAHTLGPMFEELGNTVTKADFHDLTATVDRLAEAQDRTDAQLAKLTEAQDRTGAQLAKLTEAQDRTDAQLAKLTEAQDRTDAQLAKLTEAQARTETRLVSLAESQDRTDAQVAKLTEAQGRTDVQVSELTRAVQSLVSQGERQAARLDAVLGSTFELQFRDRLTSYLGRLMRRGRLLRNDEVLDAIEQAVEPGEADELLRVDAIASGMIEGVASHVVVEVSATCGADDIDRAARRAGILRKAGLAAVPLVACKVISPELRTYACSKQVRIWCDGTILDAAA